jgi:hypothetical protein
VGCDVFEELDARPTFPRQYPGDMGLVDINGKRQALSGLFLRFKQTMNVLPDSKTCATHARRLHPFFVSAVDCRSTKALCRVGLLLLLALPGVVYPWGRLGHETVALIAAERLSPRTRQEVGAILGPDRSLASVSMWADQVKRKWPISGPWHFIDLPIGRTVRVEDVDSYCSPKGCIVSKLPEFIGILESAQSTQAEKLEALKFVVHLVGDLHQPLHCSNDDDRGGNGKKLWFEGREMSLHALWDNCLEKYPRGNAVQLAAALDRDISADEAREWSTGSVESWAYESYLIARDKIYPGYAARNGTNLGHGYIIYMRPVVDRQLEKAGVRLAWVLNHTLGDGP